MGVATCSIRPSLKTAIRSLIVSASSWSWVTKQKVMPTSRWICLSSICISRRSLRSRAPSGSSSSSTLGRLTSARARATRCRWPPESWVGRRSPYPASRTVSSAASARSRRSAARDLLDPQAVLHVAEHVHVREQRVVLEDGVDVAVERRPAGDVLAAEEDPARGRLLEARDHPQHRGLARAGRARASRRTRRRGSPGRGRRPRSRCPNRLVTPTSRTAARARLELLTVMRLGPREAETPSSGNLGERNSLRQARSRHVSARRGRSDVRRRRSRTDAVRDSSLTRVTRFGGLGRWGRMHRMSRGVLVPSPARARAPRRLCRARPDPGAAPRPRPARRHPDHAAGRARPTASRPTPSPPTARSRCSAAGSTRSASPSRR